jgi:phosphoenolpyruvate-protein kinase (PTS system EI component)
MKRKILITAAIVFASAALFTGCNTPSQKVETAKENVEEANEELAKAKQEYLADLESYRKQQATQSLTNQQMIAELKTRIAKEKEATRAAYTKRISELEQKNRDMNNKMTAYVEDGQENWKSFKAEFSRDMDELGNALTGFFESK